MRRGWEYRSCNEQGWQVTRRVRVQIAITAQHAVTCGKEQCRGRVAREESHNKLGFLQRGEEEEEYRGDALPVRSDQPDILLAVVAVALTHLVAKFDESEHQRNEHGQTHDVDSKVCCCIEMK